MAKIEFLGPLGRPSIEVDISNLQELKNYFKDDAELQNWLGICAVAVNDTLVCNLDMPISQEDKISLLPPVCGG
ncbi:MAG: MoaD/ThiS family protein [Sulfurospirillum sp.]|nr:MoaD/ThiS family protein [Sulfurospirillum sp.]MBP9612900.1 MoaD/ThiS family protein [Sulfurospirillum sp.]